MTDHIWLVTEVSDPTDAQAPATQNREKGWLSDKTRQVAQTVADRLPSLKTVALPIDQLEAKMGKFLGLVGRLFNQVDQQVGPESGMRLQKVQLQIEISSEGEVKLVAGGKAAGKGAITLEFERVEKDGK
jgi:hypothetical protein